MDASPGQFADHRPDQAQLTTRNKAIVEATFSSINTLFCQHVAAYTGSNTTLRGLDATGAWTLPELQDLLDEWLLPGLPTAEPVIMPLTCADTSLTCSQCGDYQHTPMVRSRGNGAICCSRLQGCSRPSRV
jgi:hypothetical protein